MAENSGGGDTLVIDGGNNQFVITYKVADGTSTAPVAPSFGAVGSLNNTNPAFDFSALDNGKVYTVLSGESSPVIAGGNQQFAVQYIVPAGKESTSGHAVQVNGGNNAFVVADLIVPAGNTVSVDGGNNAYVVIDRQTGSDGAAPASAAGSTVPISGVSLSGRGITGSDHGAGVIVGTPGDNSVTINGGNNQYVVDYGNAASSGSASSDLSSGGVGMSGSVSTTAASSGMPSTAELTDLLKMSPFGRILDIPGVTPDQLISGFVTATAGNGAGGSNPFAGVAPGTNPFAGGFGVGSAYPTSAYPTTSIPATGSASVPVVSTGAAPSADELGSLLQQSPFGALLNIPGFTAQDLTDAFSSSGGNPFGGNPFSFDPTSVPAITDMVSAAMPAEIATMAQSFFGAISSGSTPAQAYASFGTGSSLGQTILAGIGASGEVTIPPIVLANT